MPKDSLLACDYTLNLETFDNSSLAKDTVKIDVMTVTVSPKYVRTEEPPAAIQIHHTQTGAATMFSIEYPHPEPATCVS